MAQLQAWKQESLKTKCQIAQTGCSRNYSRIGWSTIFHRFFDISEVLRAMKKLQRTISKKWDTILDIKQWWFQR